MSLKTCHREVSLNNKLFASPSPGSNYFLLSELKTIYGISGPTISTTKNA
jgi:hypothetical protein